MNGSNDIIAEIKHRVRAISCESVTSLSGNKSVSCVNTFAGSFTPERVAFIVLADWALKVTFRVAFTFRDLGKITLENRDSSNEVERSRLVDFAKEYCNLTGGILVQLLESEERPMGLSIPIDHRASAVSDASRERASNIHHDQWFLKDNSATIQCLLTIEASDPDAVQKIVFNNVRTLIESEELEFL